MTHIATYRTYAGYLCAAIVVSTLSACGGGGGDDSPSGPAPVSVKGTAATGAPMSSAAIFMTCANRAVLSGNTDAQGNFATPQISFTYPCIGTATKGSVVYRSLLLNGTTVNFTPLTDLLVEVVLAAATTGSTSMTTAEFLTKVQSDTTFAANVSSDTSAATYRSGVIGVLRTQLIASGQTPAQADATLQAASTTSFESAVFVANGTGLDKVLDDTKAVTQNADGSVATSIKAVAKAQGDTIAPPASGGTGGTGR